MTFTPGTYYRHLAPEWGGGYVFGVPDVENWETCVPLANGELVVCTSIIHRSGGKGRGRYARLLHQRSGRRVVLYMRVSRNDIGSGQWECLDPLEVLALAEILPIV